MILGATAVESESQQGMLQNGEGSEEELFCGRSFYILVSLGAAPPHSCSPLGASEKPGIHLYPLAGDFLGMPLGSAVHTHCSSSNSKWE